MFRKLRKYGTTSMRTYYITKTLLEIAGKFSEESTEM